MRSRRPPRQALGLLLVAVSVPGWFAGCIVVDDGRPDRERLAEAATRRGDWLLAGTLWFQLFEEDGGANARAGRETARALYEQGDALGALRIGESVLARFPDELELHVLCAEIHAQHGSTEAAIASFERALALAPDRMDVLARLGEARFTAGHWDRAVGPLRRAAAAGVRSRELTLLAALAAERSGDPIGAFADYRVALRSKESTAEELVRGAHLAESPAIRAAEPLALPLAIEWLERACDRDPQAVEAHTRLGRAYRTSGSREQATLHLRRAVEIDPTNVDALTDLASVYAEAGDPTRALEFAYRALALDPDGEQRRTLEALVRSIGEAEAGADTDGEELGGA